MFRVQGVVTMGIQDLGFRGIFGALVFGVFWDPFKKWLIGVSKGSIRL